MFKGEVCYYLISVVSSLNIAHFRTKTHLSLCLNKKMTFLYLLLFLPLLLYLTSSPSLPSFLSFLTLPPTSLPFLPLIPYPSFLSFLPLPYHSFLFFLTLHHLSLPFLTLPYSSFPFFTLPSSPQFDNFCQFKTFLEDTKKKTWIAKRKFLCALVSSL